MTKEEIRAKLDAQSGGGDFQPVPTGIYKFIPSEITHIKRDSKGIMRVRLELTIDGEIETDARGKALSDVVLSSDQDGRKIWEGGALEGDQIRYFTIPLANALLKRYPDNFDAIIAMPGVDIENVAETVADDESEAQWREYFQYVIECGLSFIGKLTNRGKDAGGYDNYRLTILNDQTAE
jgi:hypothetical protein